MSDWFYTLGRWVTQHAMFCSGRAVVVDGAKVHQKPPFILAATHRSPYDIAVLLRHGPRQLDFLSITDLFVRRDVAWLFRMMNAFPLDRHKPDTATVKQLVRRLKSGRAIGMFPEAAMNRGEESAVVTRKIVPGVGRLAALARVPILPCVILGSENYEGSWTHWLPLRRTRYGVIFGDLIPPAATPEETEEKLIDAWVGLHPRLMAAMRAKFGDVAIAP